VELILLVMLVWLVQQVRSYSDGILYEARPRLEEILTEEGIYIESMYEFPEIRELALGHLYDQVSQVLMT